MIWFGTLFLGYATWLATGGSDPATPALAWTIRGAVWILLLVGTSNMVEKRKGKIP
jgi:aryl-alcohol dehydrogenase-like predicted oxidoreductase